MVRIIISHAAHVFVRNYLFTLCSVWTVAQMVLVLLEFFHVGRFVVPAMMPLYNLILIAVYAAVKEGARWAHRRIGKRRGEYFFVAWWLFALALHCTSALTSDRYLVPHVTFINVWFVSMVYVASAISKFLNRMLEVELRIHRVHGR